MWKTGDAVAHRFNAELGTGRVVECTETGVLVYFPQTEEILSFHPGTDALELLALRAGASVLDDGGAMVRLERELEDGRWLVDDGRTLAVHDLWPVARTEDPLEELASGRVGRLEDFRNLLDALRLQAVREAEGLGSFLGGRIRLFPHQLYAAERACARDPVRWLLADGVGLGKTVEACLVMNHLLHRGRARRVLVVAPESLTVQWLGELWRKHHQVFALLDGTRLQDAAREQGREANPFSSSERSIIALETLIAEPYLVGLALEAGIDLLVVDEAHHLQRAAGHPGNQAYRAIAPLAHAGGHLLLLTATPMEDDAEGFMRLLQLLVPEELPEDEDLVARLADGAALPDCTSATRAADVGGWPPRVPQPVAIGSTDWTTMLQLEESLRRRPAAHQLELAQRSVLVSRAQSSPAALLAKLKPGEHALAELARAAADSDPRLDWLVRQAPLWRRAGEKTLLFVAHRETLEWVKQALERRAHMRVGLFHEELSTKRRDMEAAQLRLPEGPSLLVSTECGGEGRNFQICDRLVLFDLPWHPGVVEQRIGRLDRVGRDRPTEVVYFRPPGGLGAAVVRMYEELGIFEASVGGLERELKLIAREVARVAADPEIELAPDLFHEVLENARTARTRVEEAAYHQLHRNPYDESMAEGILARVPAELEKLNAEVVLRAAARFGFEVEAQRGRDRWYIALGNESLVNQLPGVPEETRIIGTFSREEAVADETADFFSAGHPLVEGILAELLQGPHGRTACFELPGQREGFGLLAVIRRDGELTAVAVDAAGRALPELARRALDGNLEPHHVDYRPWLALPEWQQAVRGMARHLPKGAPVRALAAFRVVAS